ncbi:MAG TPA: DUF3137 domain-containing protein [Vicinamibacteria bacterium]|nr:DUF3137 domain-containing protein [Vicinamibacteria bacterium]
MSALARSNDTPITSEADLRAWFDLEVHPFLARHAASLARLGKYGLYPLAAILLTFPGAVLLLAFGAFWPSLVCVAILIPSVAVVTVRGPIYMAGGAGFRALFKHRVVASIVARVLPGASYDPDLALAGSVLDASGLFHDEIAYRGDDLVRGTTGRTPFAMGDVHAGITRRGDLRSGFEGLLFHAEFNRSLVGRTVVLPAGQTPQALVLNRGLAAVGLESPEFAALFSVYASDPIEARYVLTPNTMERLVDLARTVGRPLYAAFDRRRVFVATDNGKGAFEALAFGGEKAWDEVRGFAALFESARAIVEELELNTRIWTKGFALEAETEAASVSQPSAWSRVAARGAWAFQTRPNLPFAVDDMPAPPAGARIERRPGGGLFVGYRPAWNAPFFLLALVLLAAVAAVDPGWWASHPELATLAQLSTLLRAYLGQAALLGASLALAAVYRVWTRVRAVDAGPGTLRIGKLGPDPAFSPARIRRVFAAEDTVMAQVEGSWIPLMLSPRLGGHGAAVWLAAEIETALSGGPR